MKSTSPFTLMFNENNSNRHTANVHRHRNCAILPDYRVRSAASRSRVAEERRQADVFRRYESAACRERSAYASHAEPSSVAVYYGALALLMPRYDAEMPAAPLSFDDGLAILHRRVTYCLQIFCSFRRRCPISRMPPPSMPIARLFSWLRSAARRFRCRHAFVSPPFACFRRRRPPLIFRFRCIPFAERLPPYGFRCAASNKRLQRVAIRAHTPKRRRRHAALPLSMTRRRAAEICSHRPSRRTPPRLPAHYSAFLPHASAYAFLPRAPSMLI